MIIIIIVIIMVNDPNASIIGMRREMIHRQIVQLSMDEWIQVWFGVGDGSSFFLERVIIAWWHNSISHDVMCWLLCATWFHLLWTVMRWDVSRSRKNSLHGEWIMMMALKASHDVEPVWFIMQAITLSILNSTLAAAKAVKNASKLLQLQNIPTQRDFTITDYPIISPPSWCLQAVCNQLPSMPIGGSKARPTTEPLESFRRTGLID